MWRILFAFALLQLNFVRAEDSEKPSADAGKLVVKAGEKYEITIDTTETPQLRNWAEQELAPAVKEWYPKIVQMLPGDGFEPASSVTITFSKDMRGVAATGGNHIHCAAQWFEKNLQGEAKGAVIHELVHVVQDYGWGRKRNPDATRTPGWVVEGIADYIRWFKFEPASKGAEITLRNLDRAKYDANYRITANFLNWVTQKYGDKLIVQLNAAAREGKYREDLWKDWTNKTVQELGDEWKKANEERLRPATGA